MSKLIRRSPEQAKADKEKVEYDRLCEEFEEPYKSKGSAFFPVPSTVDRVLSYWQARDTLSKMKMPIKDGQSGYLSPSKVFKETVLLIKRLIAGTAFTKTEFVRQNRKFTVEEILLAIDRFYTAATSDRHFPLRKDSLRRFNLKNFIYNPFYKEEKFRSLFLFYVENEPRLRMQAVEETPTDRFPPLTKSLMRRTQLMFRFDPDNYSERKKIIACSNRLYDFWTINERANRWTSPMYADGLVREFLDSLLVWQEDKAERKVSPNTILQEFAYRIFEEHCYNMELLVKEDLQIEGIQDELLTLEEFEKQPREEQEVYVEPTTFDLQKDVESLFESEEEDPQKSWNDKFLLKKRRAEKMQAQYENSPFD